jgi:hypothetical protein
VCVYPGGMTHHLSGLSGLVASVAAPQAARHYAPHTRLSAADSVGPPHRQCRFCGSVVVPNATPVTGFVLLLWGYGVPCRAHRTLPQLVGSHVPIRTCNTFFVLLVP